MTNIAGSSTFTQNVESYPAQNQNGKYLCNVEGVTSSGLSNTGACKYGSCDCLQYCYSGFCQNCGQPIPVCVQPGTNTAITNAINSCGQGGR